MAYILKNGRSITNPYDGTSNTAAYLVIDQLSIDKSVKGVHFWVAIYANQQARANRLAPIQTHEVFANGANFDTYFPTTTNAKVWTQAYDYLEAISIEG